MPSNIDLDAFFDAANEKYRLNQFEASHQHVDASTIFEFGRTVAVQMNFSDFASCRSVSEHLLKCRQANVDPATVWSVNPTVRKRCLVHEAGGAVLVDDGHFIHVFFNPKRLSVSETHRLVESLGDLAASAAELIGLGSEISLPWETIDDEKFESLCYDLIRIDSRFDEQTIKKMGKSRSRDGGRDIVVNELSRPGKPGRKWIFQCKLIRDNSSLTASKLQNIGDMLEQYKAEGFGVMTSGPIDATLYDRLESICENRKIVEGHFSVYELERALSKHHGIRRRYFSDSPTHP